MQQAQTEVQLLRSIEAVKFGIRQHKRSALRPVERGKLDPNSAGPRGIKLLHRASFFLWMEGVQVLVRAGADPLGESPGLPAVSLPASGALVSFLDIIECDPDAAALLVPEFLGTCRALELAGSPLVVPKSFKVSRKFLKPCADRSCRGLCGGECPSSTCARALSVVFGGGVLDLIV